MTELNFLNSWKASKINWEHSSRDKTAFLTARSKQTQTLVRCVIGRRLSKFFATSISITT